MSVRARSATAPKHRGLPGDLAMKSKQTGTFDAQTFLDAGGIARTSVEYRRADVIFTQGEQRRVAPSLAAAGAKWVGG